MSAPDFKSFYLTLTPADRVRLLARFAFDLTIDSRDTYEPQSDRVIDPSRLRGINELQHRVLSQFSSWYENTLPLRDEESFVTLLVEAATELRCSFALTESVTWCRDHGVTRQSKAV